MPTICLTVCQVVRFVRSPLKNSDCVPGRGFYDSAHQPTPTSICSWVMKQTVVMEL